MTTQQKSVSVVKTVVRKPKHIRMEIQRNLGIRMAFYCVRTECNLLLTQNISSVIYREIKMKTTSIITEAFLCFILYFWTEGNDFEPYTVSNCAHTLSTFYFIWLYLVEFPIS